MLVIGQVLAVPAGNESGINYLGRSSKTLKRRAWWHSSSNSTTSAAQQFLCRRSSKRSCVGTHGTNIRRRIRHNVLNGVVSAARSLTNRVFSFV